MPIEGRRDLGEFEFELEECVLAAIDGAPDTLRESAGEGGAGRLEKSVVSMDVDVGLLEEIGVGFEEVLVEEGRGRSGMMILVLSFSPWPPPSMLSPLSSSFDIPVEENTSLDVFGVSLDTSKLEV